MPFDQENANLFSICIQALFSGFYNGDWLNRFETIVNKISIQLNTPYSHFSVKFRSGNEWKIKNYKLTPKNLNKLKELSRNSEIDLLTFITTSITNPDFSNPEVYIKCRKKETPEHPFCEFYAQFEYKHFKGLLGVGWKEKFIEILSLCEIELGKIEYGFIHPLEKSKMPNYYFTGLGNVLQMTEEEAISNKKWNQNMTLYNSKLRDIYLGNIWLNSLIDNSVQVWEEIQKVSGTKFKNFHDDRKILFLNDSFFVDENRRRIIKEIALKNNLII